MRRSSRARKGSRAVEADDLWAFPIRSRVRGALCGQPAGSASAVRAALRHLKLSDFGRCTSQAAFNKRLRQGYHLSPSCPGFKILGLGTQVYQHVLARETCVGIVLSSNKNDRWTYRELCRHE